MKNQTILLILFLLFNTAVVLADDISSVKVPKAFLPENTFEFESVIEGDKISHDFVLKNNGTAPLTIIKLEAG